MPYGTFTANTKGLSLVPTPGLSTHKKPQSWKAVSNIASGSCMLFLGRQGGWNGTRRGRPEEVGPNFQVRPHSPTQRPFSLHRQNWAGTGSRGPLTGLHTSPKVTPMATMVGTVLLPLRLQGPGTIGMNCPFITEIHRPLLGGTGLSFYCLLRKEKEWQNVLQLSC